MCSNSLASNDTVRSSKLKEIYFQMDVIAYMVITMLKVLNGYSLGFNSNHNNYVTLLRDAALLMYSPLQQYQQEFGLKCELSLLF